MYRPKRHNHVGRMLWEDDFCCCRDCGQKWFMTEKGWKAVPDEVTENTFVQSTDDPYKRFNESKRESEPERLRRLARQRRKPRSR